MLVMVVFFIAFRWIHLSTPLIRLFLLVLILLLMPTLNFLPVWFALSLLRFRLPSRLLTIPLQQLNGLETLVIIMVANKYAFLQITRRRFLNEWEAFKKVISRRNIRRRITIPLTLSNLKLLRRITRTENILHR